MYLMPNPLSLFNTGGDSVRHGRYKTTSDFSRCRDAGELIIKVIIMVTAKINTYGVG